MACTIYILNLHGIGTPRHELPPGEQRVWLNESQFQQVLDLAAARANVELTFDDANESDYTVALPALQARGLKARFFIVVDRVDRPGYLSRPQIAALLAAGMGIGSHGMRHRAWAGLGSSELHEELIEARNRLEEITGGKIDHAACPFGSYDRQVIRGVRSAGYRSVYTSDGGPACPGSFLLPRSSVYRTYHHDTLKTMLSENPRGARQIWRRLKRQLKCLR